jgi:hypothetical protein
LILDHVALRRREQDFGRVKAIAALKQRSIACGYICPETHWDWRR